MKKYACFLLLLLLIAFSSCNSGKFQEGLYAEITTNKGVILLELFAEDVPMTVANFVSLAEGTNNKVTKSLQGKRFYDGLKFHRVVSNYIIQTGDPLGTGNGNTGYVFPNEIPLDDAEELLYKHEKGVLSMANYGSDTNSSQFFITHKTISKLDGKYSVFGKVKEGQKVADEIQESDVIIKVTIIRVGKFAENFKAFEVFEKELAKAATILVDEKNAKKLAFQKEKGIEKAVKTDSGLQILELEKGTGKKFNRAVETTMSYMVYLATGELIQATNKETPFTFILDAQPMISGVTEAILKMKEGGKKRLFIPYYLGYGEVSFGPFPSKSDLIFELELIKVGK